MSLRHLRAVIRKEIRHILRDRATFVLVLLTPLATLLVMAYALVTDIRHVPIAVLDYERSASSLQFIQQIFAGDDLILHTIAGSMDEVERLLLNGEVKAAVVIHPAFSAEIARLSSIPLQIIIDGTEPESGAFAVDHITLRAQAFIENALARQLQAQGVAAGALEPVDLRVRTWYNPGLKPRVDLIPGLISMVLGFPALSVALTLAHEREHGTMEQLMASPIRRVELLIGKTLPYVFVGLVNVIVIPVLAMTWFQVPFNGSFPLFFGLSALFLFAILSMGMVIGVFIRTQPAALALSFLVIFFPGFFLTGIFFPIASMPEIMRLESMFLPGTHYAVITRGVFLPGNGLEVLWPYALMLAFLGLVFTAVSALFFRKKLG